MDPGVGPLLVVGFAGSLHCVGMCGGFVLSIDRAGRRPWRRVGAQAAFHLGKTSTYVLLGAAAGAAGGAVVRGAWFPAAQAALAVVAGVLMVLAGLQIAGWLGELRVGGLFGPDSPYGRAVRGVANARGPAAPFVLGALTGLLPCPLVYAFLAAALATGGLLPAMGTMAVLGLASLPALALVVAVGASVTPLVRRRITRVAGVVVVVLGGVTVLRGVAPQALHAVFGHPTTPAPTAPPAAAQAGP
jgi:sulfite exporter TauE/SafE